MSDNVVSEVENLCLEIKRLGETEVSFLVLFEDDIVTNTFEALVGTLRGAKKRGYLDYKGEMLLKGRHDNVVIKLTEKGLKVGAAPTSKVSLETVGDGDNKTEPVHPTLTDRGDVGVVQTPKCRGDAGVPPTPTDGGDAGVPPMPSDGDTGVPPTPADGGSAGVRANAGVPSIPKDRSNADIPPISTGGDNVEAPTSEGDAGAPLTPTDGGDVRASPMSTDGDDTGIPPTPTAGSNAGVLGNHGGASAPTDHDDTGIQPAPTGVKDAEVRTSVGGAGRSSKWQVDMSYINHRTDDPNRLEPRRDKDTEPALPFQATVQTAPKLVEGKWEKVDVSYIDRRTQDVDRLLVRKNTQSVGSDASSATVKKEDGKWKVDMSYIDHHTLDTSNLSRKDAGGEETRSFSNPAETKYDYQILKDAESRPPDVDPAHKEKYLSDEEFQNLFGMPMVEFHAFPNWKQQKLKKEKKLF